jgi:hypothetical protein
MVAGDEIIPAQQKASARRDRFSTRMGVAFPQAFLE